MSMIPTVMVQDFMRQLLPKTSETLLGVPLDQMATFRSRLTMPYFHVITLLVTIGLGNRPRLRRGQRRDQSM